MRRLGTAAAVEAEEDDEEAAVTAENLVDSDVDCVGIAAPRIEGIVALLLLLLAPPTVPGPPVDSLRRFVEDDDACASSTALSNRSHSSWSLVTRSFAKATR